MDKLNRKYLLKVQSVEGDFIEIETPLTVEFDVTKSVLSSTRTAFFRVYNLAEWNRNNIRKDWINQWEIRKVSFQAGYGSNLSTLLDGFVSTAWSVREGNNFITQIEGDERFYVAANAFTDQQFKAGTPYSEIVRNLVRSLGRYDISEGLIGDYPGNLLRGNSYSGSTVELLNELTKGGFFVDNGKAYCLKDPDCRPGDIPLIDSSAGLLGTPTRQETYIYFDMIFEPRLLLGQKIELQSDTDKNFNGVYKVIALKHRGTISDAVCGDAVTTVGLSGGLAFEEL